MMQRLEGIDSRLVELAKQVHEGFNCVADAVDELSNRIENHYDQFNLRLGKLQQARS